MIKLILAFLLVILIVSAFFAFQKVTTPTATVSGRDFKLLIARTEEERQNGLSKSEKLNEDEAMLFIFDKNDYYKFWMKDMKFPLDIIFIKGNIISKIVDNAQPSKNIELTIYHPDEPVDKVLEINGGLSKKYNFKVGDKVEFRNIQ